MSTPLVDLHKTLCDLWRELGETDQTSSECWQDIAITLQFSAVPGLQQLGIELQSSLRRDISGKLFSSGAELQAIHTYIFTAIGAAFSGEKYPAAALSAVNSLRVNAQQNLSSANQWSAAVDVDNVAGLDEDVRARLNLWLAKATQLFKLALMQLLKGQPDGLVALQKLLPRLVSATSACASHPLWVKAAAFVAALDTASAALTLPRLLLRYLLQNLHAIASSKTPDQELGQAAVLIRQLDVYIASQKPSIDWRVLAADSQFDQAQAALSQLQASLLDFFEDGSEFDVLNSVPERATLLAEALRGCGLAHCAEYADTMSEYVERQILSRKILPSAERINQLTQLVIAVEWALQLAAWQQPVEPALSSAEKSFEYLSKAVGESVVAKEPDSVAMPTNDDVDPELLDTFIEEAQEVLQDIATTLSANTLDADALADIRRGFHTLKGSGRMVGAGTIAEFSWQLENSYNQLLQMGAVFDVDHGILIRAAMEELQCLVADLAKGLHSSLSPRAEQISVLLQRQVRSDPPSSADWLDAIQFKRKSEPALRPAIQELLTIMEAFVERASQQGSETHVPSDVLHALHGLRTEAKALSLFALSQMLSPLEAKLKLASTLDTEALSLLREAIAMVGQQLRGGSDLAALDTLSQRIAAWDVAQTSAVENAMATLLAVGDVLDSMYPAMLSQDVLFDWHGHAESLLMEVAALEASQPALATYLSAMGNFILRHIVDKQVLTHLEPSLSHAFDALNLIAADQSPRIDESLLERLAAQLEDNSAQMEESELAPPAILIKPFKDDPTKPLLESPTGSDETAEVTEETAPGKFDSQGAADDIDPELVDIFNEEAQELLTAISTSMHDWQREPRQTAPKAALQRLLHTLKGGARMVGWQDMAAIAHTFESDIVAIHDTPSPQDFSRWQQHQLAMENIRTTNMQSGDEHEITSADPPQFVEHDKALEVLRVSVDSLEQLANISGELTIARSQLDEQRRALMQVVSDLDQAQRRTMDQLRRLEAQTQAQIAYRREQVDTAVDEVFDPLEMDRYTQLQQLTNGLMESLSDIADLKTTANDVLQHMESTLQQQGRMNTSLVQGLHQVRMIPVARILPRLRRLVDQIAGELGKSVTFTAERIEGELQREVLERVATSLEHIVRNALDHGIESLAKRQQAGKAAVATISLTVLQCDNELIFKLSDDGAGIDHDKVLAKALTEGIVGAEDTLSHEEILRLIMRPGFSTAQGVSEISGRGVGLDVVENEVLTLGGRVELHSTLGEGSEFTLVVPFTQSVNRALLVDVGGQRLALPFVGVNAIIRVSRREIDAMRADTSSRLSYGDQHYRFCELSHLLGLGRSASEKNHTFSPLILVSTGDGNFAILVDALKGSRDLVIKSLGPQFGKLLGIAGATIMGDGSVINILDLPPLLRAWQQGLRFTGSVQRAEDAQSQRAQILIVDDSITVRKITSRLLARHHYGVETAKDGVEGLEKLAQAIPDAIMLDVEMPRMDGFEFASQVRHSPQWCDIPIVMVSSRSGEKHRRRAEEVGVDFLLSKPYNEEILLAMLEKMIQHRQTAGEGDG